MAIFKPYCHGLSDDAPAEAACVPMGACIVACRSSTGAQSEYTCPRVRTLCARVPVLEWLSTDCTPAFGLAPGTCCTLFLVLTRAVATGCALDFCTKKTPFTGSRSLLVYEHVYVLDSRVLESIYWSYSARNPQWQVKVDRIVARQAGPSAVLPGLLC